MFLFELACKSIGIDFFLKKKNHAAVVSIFLFQKGFLFLHLARK